MDYKKFITLIRAVKRQPARLNLKRSLSKLEQKSKTFFVIIMPASIHVALLSINKIKDVGHIVLVGNGLSAAEKKWIVRNVKGYPLVSSCEKLHHHQVINVLLSVWKVNFGILDYDCFVMDENIIYRMTELSGDEIVSSPYLLENKGLNIKFPETFLLYFQIKKIKFLMDKYKIDSRIYFWRMLKPSVLKALEQLGITKLNMPEPQKDYFDTLKLIFLMAIKEGMSFKFVADYTDSHGEPETVYHIGSIAKPNVISNSYSFRGSYFWRRSLEAINEPILYEEAISKFGATTASELVNMYPDLYDSMDKTYLDFVDKTI